MERIRRLAADRPFSFAVLSVIVVLAVMGVAAGGAAGVLDREISDDAMQVAGQVAGVVVLVVVMWRLGWLAPAGVTRLGDRDTWVAIAVILVYTGLCALWAFFSSFAVDLSVDSAHAAVLLHTTLAGVVEELLFRGLVLYVLLSAWGQTRRGTVAAVAVSAALFGAPHLFNLATASADVTMLQATNAALSGLLYGALVVISGSLWPAVALHSLVNLLVNAAAENIPGFVVSADDYWTYIALQVPVTLYAAYLLTRHRPRTDRRPRPQTPVASPSARG